MTVGDVQHPIEDSRRGHGAKLCRSRDGEERGRRVEQVGERHIHGVTRFSSRRRRDQLLHRQIGTVQDPTENLVLDDREEAVSIRLVPFDLRGVLPVRHHRLDAEPVETIVMVVSRFSIERQHGDADPRLISQPSRTLIGAPRRQAAMSSTICGKAVSYVARLT